MRRAGTCRPATARRSRRARRDMPRIRAAQLVRIVLMDPPEVARAPRRRGAARVEKRRRAVAAAVLDDHQLDVVATEALPAVEALAAAPPRC